MNKSAIPTSAQAELREDAMLRAGEFLNMRLILLVEEAGSNWGALLQAQEATAALKHDRTPDVGGVLGERYRERDSLEFCLSTVHGHSRKLLHKCGGVAF